MTNRERINKMSNKEMAKALNNDNGCDFCIFGKYEFCHDKHIDGKYISCAEAIEMWLEKEEEQTADEMLKELGYEKVEENSYKTKYTKKTEYEDFIIEIIYQAGGWWCGKFANKSEVKFMNNKEHEAICKKLEELKNDKQ